MTSSVELAVDGATSMGDWEGLMTSDAEDDVVIGGMMMVVVVSSVTVGSGTTVILPTVVVFPGTDVGKGGITGVGSNVKLTSGVLIFGKDVKLEGTTTGVG